MATPNLTQTTTLTSQQYAIRLLQLLQEFGEELIKVDTVLIVIKMMTRHAVDNAVVFATGDAYQFGALEFTDGDETRRFLDRLSDNVVYAAVIDGQFEVHRYPYRSQALGEWIFVGPEDDGF
ncbi:MAG TPA: hypothetical protein VMN57_05150 [Anaerolineales bacterium]|nr:hypothetical protein [Anaerolineales bacterium]